MANLRGQESRDKMSVPYIINADNFERFRKELKIDGEKERKKLIGFTSADDDLNRKILEKEKVDIFMPLLFYRKDRQKQRDSGFNHVLAKIAKKNNVIIGINFQEIIVSHGTKKANVLARVSQNIKICSKNKLKMKFIAFEERNIYDLKSLGLVLGMPTWMTKEL
jgi:ribonuclease P/MRP protein subunit RPP1